MKFNVLGDFFTEYVERGPTDDTPTYSVSEKYGLVIQTDRFKKKIALDDRKKYKVVPPGHVCYNPYLFWAGAVGVNFCDNSLAVSPAYIVLAPKEAGLERFWHFFLRSESWLQSVNDIATGSVTRRRTAPLSEILGLPVSVDVNDAALAELYLRTLDNKIANNRALASDLEAIARALFKSWFVDFDPVHAKAAGEKPVRMPDNIAALFSDSFQESELGMIPTGWVAGSIADYCDNSRASCSASDIEPGMCYVGLEHIEKHCLTLWQSGRGADVESNKSHFQQGDLLFGKLRPYLHKVAIAPEDGICSTDVLVVRAKSDAWRSFTYSSLFQDKVMQFVSDASSGTRMPRTNWNTLSSFQIAVPPVSLAKAFDAVAQPMIDLMCSKIQENNALAGIRDALIPRLISGKLKVQDAERELASA